MPRAKSPFCTALADNGPKTFGKRDSHGIPIENPLRAPLLSPRANRLGRDKAG